MAGARVYRIGTVFSRAEALIKRKAAKEENSPVWLDIYRKFPPKFEPSYGRPAPQIELRQIFYEEDILRAKINKKYPRMYEDINLKGKAQTKSQKCVNLWQNLVTDGVPSEEAMDKAMKEIYEEKSNKDWSLSESNFHDR